MSGRWGGLAPDLRPAPGSGGREVYVDGNAGENVGWTTAADSLARTRVWGRIRDLLKEFREPVAQLRNGIAGLKQVGTNDAAGEVEAVAGGIEMAFKGRGLFSTERKRYREEVEAVGVRRILRRCEGSACAVGVGDLTRGRRCGMEDDVAQWYGPPGAD